MSILSLVRLGNCFAYGRLSYGQASMYRPRPTYYVTVLVFVCLYVYTTLAEINVYLGLDQNPKTEKTSVDFIHAIINISISLAS